MCPKGLQDGIGRGEREDLPAISQISLLGVVTFMPLSGVVSASSLLPAELPLLPLSHLTHKCRAGVLDETKSHRPSGEAMFRGQDSVLVLLASGAPPASCHLCQTSLVWGEVGDSVERPERGGDGGLHRWTSQTLTGELGFPGRGEAPRPAVPVLSLH